MPFDGAGNFLRTRDWTTDQSNGIDMLSVNFDQEDDNFAGGLSNCVTKDGQTLPTADLPMNGRKHINCAAPINPTDYATKGYTDTGLAAKADTSHTQPYSSLTGVPSTFPPATHNHDASAVTSGFLPDARISQTSVTQHEPAIGTEAAAGNRVVRRDISGHIYIVNLNQSSSNNENPAVSQVLVTNGSDNFARKASIAHLKRAVTLSCTIQADPGGTPSGSPGDVFFYY